MNTHVWEIIIENMPAAITIRADDVKRSHKPRTLRVDDIEITFPTYIVSIYRVS